MDSISISSKTRGWIGTRIAITSATPSITLAKTILCTVFFVDLWCANDALHGMHEAPVATVSKFPKEFLVRLVLKIQKTGKDASLKKMLARMDYDEKIVVGEG
jgi:hypothetical protein